MVRHAALVAPPPDQNHAINRQHNILTKYDCGMSGSGCTNSASPKCQKFLDGPKPG